ncbi:MAG: hypothetical protein R3E64_16120 [Halioglobus sp.]
MEKSIYFLRKPSAVSIETFRDSLLVNTVAQLRSLGASQITLNIADLNTLIQEQAAGRLIGPWQTLSAVVAYWHDCVDGRALIEAHLREISDAIDGYLVTESVPQGFDPVWEGGERRPGVTQFGANGKPEHVTDEEFYYNWQVIHSTQSFDLHPRRWSYVRNAVARSLTEGAPAYRAIVSEHFRDIEDFTDDQRYFGSPQAVADMLEELPGFCDFNNMVSVPTSEYYFS